MEERTLIVVKMKNYELRIKNDEIYSIIPNYELRIMNVGIE